MFLSAFLVSNLLRSDRFAARTTLKDQINEANKTVWILKFFYSMNIM